jgi:hypothetical protein
MKTTKENKLTVMILFLSIITSLVTAQNLKITSGGFGHFSGGPAYTDASFINTLVGSEFSGKENYNIGNTGWLYGGEGFGLKDRWFFGGGGFAQYIPSAESTEALVNYGMGGGYFKAGYLVQQKSRSFAYCFGSVGGGELAMTIKNRSENTFVLNENTQVLPYSTNKYKIATVFFDAGIGSKFLVTPVISDASRCGGLVVGIDLGCKIGSPVGNWQLKNNDVTLAVPSTRFMPYVRLTFGGGLFNRE